jgi:hypothetical protein
MRDEGLTHRDLTRPVEIDELPESVNEQIGSVGEEVFESKRVRKRIVPSKLAQRNLDVMHREIMLGSQTTEDVSLDEIDKRE